MYTEIIDLEESGKYRLYCRLRKADNFDAGGKRPALVYIPGGGFGFCDPDDQEAMLYKFMSQDYHVFTYTYAVGADYRFPDVLIYLSRALKRIRDHADEWNVDPGRIIVGGCSAGAHISASLGGLWNRPFVQEPAGCTGTQNRPDVVLLCYGPLYCNQLTDDGLLYVPSGDLVGPHTPPTFVSHCGDDGLVPVDQSLAYATALCKAGVDLSVFISGNGEHGGLQNIVPKATVNHQLMVMIDDWFGAFLKFANNEFGVSPMPVQLEPMGPPDEVLPEELQSGEGADDMPPMGIGPVLDANGNRMGTFAADLKLGFGGGAGEPYDNVLK